MPTIELIINILYSVMGTLLVCLVGFLLAWLFWRILRVKAGRNHKVLLENKGNCRNIYYLEVKSSQPSLSFSLSYKGLPLAAVYLPDETDVSAEIMEADNLSNQKEPSQQKNAAPSAGQPAKAAKTGKSVSSKAGKFASTLEVIGKLLPGSMGTKLRQQASSTRAMQAQALRTSRAPQNARRQVTGFHQLGTSKNASSSEQTKALSGESNRENLNHESLNDESLNPAYFVQTPLIEPGQSLVLQLNVMTRRRRHYQGSYPYTIEVLPVPVDFPDQEPPPYSKNGTVTFKPVAWWRYFFPIFSTLIFVLGSVIGLVFLYQFIWL